MPVFNSWTILVFEKLLDTKLVRNSGNFIDPKGSLPVPVLKVFVNYYSDYRKHR